MCKCCSLGKVLGICVDFPFEYGLFSFCFLITQVSRGQLKGRAWLFVAQCWLAVNQSDGRVERILGKCTRGIGFFKVQSPHTHTLRYKKLILISSPLADAESQAIRVFGRLPHLDIFVQLPLPQRVHTHSETVCEPAASAGICMCQHPDHITNGWSGWLIKPRV